MQPFAHAQLTLVARIQHREPFAIVDSDLAAQVALRKPSSASHARAVASSAMGSSVFAPGAKEAEEKEEEKVVGEAILGSSPHRTQLRNSNRSSKVIFLAGNSSSGVRAWLSAVSCHCHIRSHRCYFALPILL